MVLFKALLLSGNLIFQHRGWWPCLGRCVPEFCYLKCNLFAGYLILKEQRGGARVTVDVWRIKLKHKKQ